MNHSMHKNLLSGIGNADYLKSVGIEPVLNLPGVGENLQDHLEVYVQQEATKPVTLYSCQQYHKMPIIGAQWFLTGTGVCAGNHLHTGAFIRSRADPELDHPDIQFHFLPRNQLLKSILELEWIILFQNDQK